MRPLLLLTALLALNACERPSPADTAPPVVVEPETPAVQGETRPAPVDLKLSVVRVNSTQQGWNPAQPWEKNPPSKRRALAPITGDQRVLTTAELVADVTYLEFESPDGTRFTPAKVIAMDYEANLALLGPASEEEGARFFEGTTPLETADAPRIGQSIEILQVENNGMPLLTTGTLQSVDVSPNFLPGHSFLTYQVKASMQSAASSYSLPVLQNNQLVGVLISYDGKEQISQITATDIVSRFLVETANGEYKGFPSLGVSIARTEDSSFRQWLKLGDDQGGIYVSNVRKGGAAETAGVKKGDVILSIDGHDIDRRGYYQHPGYGSIFWGHLVRGEKRTGDTVTMDIIREGEPLEITATLTREEEDSRLVPNYNFDKAPNFLVKGGFIFQELSRPLLEAFGEDWTSRAPLNLLDAYENPEKYEESADRIVFLSASIPTPATIGYERLRNLIVKKVNGKDVRDMRTLIAAFDGNMKELHSIEFAEEDFTVYLDDTISTAVDSQLLKQGLTRLSRAE